MASTGEPWRLGHRPALDGLRGIAILLVIACHSSPGHLATAGSVGVTLFFTLSGFLITTLLLEEWQRRGSVSLQRFYRRRALRLLPALFTVVAFYGVLAVAIGFPVSVVFAQAGSVLLYVGNWFGVHHTLGMFGHTWSLAVEEQFYLVWPLLVVFAVKLRSRGLLAVVAIAGSAYAIAARLLLWDDGAGLQRVYMGSDTHADALLFGCLLGLAMCYVPVGRSRPAVAVVFVAVLMACSPAGNGFGRYVVVTTAVPILAAALIFVVVRGEGVRWLEWSPLVGIGRVSYGLYLWHFPLLIVVRPALEPSMGWTGSLVFLLAVAAALTWLSWRYIERPFLRRKNAASAGGERWRRLTAVPPRLEVAEAAGAVPGE